MIAAAIAPIRHPGVILVLVMAAASAIAVATVLAGPTAPILVAAAVVLTYITIRMPGLLLAAFLLIPFYKASAQEFSPLDITPVLAFLCVAQLIPVARARRVRTVSVVGAMLWMLLAVTVLAGALYAPDPEGGFFEAITFMLLVIVPVPAAAIRVGEHERHLRHFVWAFGLMGTATVLLGIIEMSRADRLIVLAGNEIQTSRAALLVPLLAMAVMPRVRSAPARLLLVGVGVAAVLVALASGSRGPIVALLVLGIVGAVRYVSRPRMADIRLLSITIVMVAVSIGAVVTGAVDIPETATYRFEVFGEFVQDLATGSPTEGTSDTSSAARLRLMDTAFAILQDHPVAGAGTGGFAALSPGLLGPSAADEYPHNALLQLGAEHGLLGLMLFLGLAALAVMRPITPGSYGHIVRMMFVYFLINAMFSGNVYDDRTLWGLLVLLILTDLPPVEMSEPHIIKDGWRGSYLATADSAQPSWVDVLRAAGWHYPKPPPFQPPREPGPYALPDEIGGDHR